MVNEQINIFCKVNGHKLAIVSFATVREGVGSLISIAKTFVSRIVMQDRVISDGMFEQHLFCSAYL